MRLPLQEYLRCELGPTRLHSYSVWGQRNSPLRAPREFSTFVSSSEGRTFRSVPLVTGPLPQACVAFLYVQKRYKEGRFYLLAKFGTFIFHTLSRERIRYSPPLPRLFFFQEIARRKKFIVANIKFLQIKFFVAHLTLKTRYVLQYRKCNARQPKLRRVILVKNSYSAKSETAPTFRRRKFSVVERQPARQLWG